MKLSDLIGKVQEEQRDGRHAKLAKEREFILKTLRRDLNEEEYQALAAELRPRVEGYAIVWKGREYIVHVDNEWHQRVQIKWGGTRTIFGEYKHVKTGRELIEWLAERSEG